MEVIRNVDREKKLRQTTLWLNSLMAFCALFSLASIVTALGWQLSETQVTVLLALSYANLGVFLSEEVARLFCVYKSVWNYLRTCRCSRYEGGRV